MILIVSTIDTRMYTVPIPKKTLKDTLVLAGICEARALHTVIVHRLVDSKGLSCATGPTNNVNSESKVA